MFDSNRNERNIIFKDEFDEWAAKNKNLKIVYTVSDEDGRNSSSSPWTGEHGRINKEMLNKYLNNDELQHSVFYVCGPPAMLNAMKSLLENELNITKERIKVEEFTGY
jgi:NAD(P)H-flavin reductase